MRHAIAAMAFSASALTSCSTQPASGAAPAPSGTTVVSSVDHPAWSRNAVIYEVNIRQYTPAGTFAALIWTATFRACRVRF